MKAKKIILTTTALLGASALAFGAAKVVQEQKRLRNREEIVRTVRDFFLAVDQSQQSMWSFMSQPTVVWSEELF